jgi:hypothetical protein
MLTVLNFKIGESGLATPRGSGLGFSAGFFVSAFWWGSLTTIGFVVVPLLFVWVSPKALAGLVAGHLFEWVSWVNVLAPLLLWFLARALNPTSPHGADSMDLSPPHGREGAQSVEDADAFSARWRYTVWALGGSVALAAWMLAVVIPHITQGLDRAIWHGMGTLTYALMWILASALMLKSRQFWS